MYKHSQSQLSTFSIKASVSSYSEPQTSSATKLPTMSVPSLTDKHQNNSVLCSQNTIKNDASITNIDDIESCDTQKKQINISIISSPNHHLQRIYSISSSTCSSNTTKILPLVGKEYMCFITEGKSDQAARCIKSRIMTKATDSFLSIDKFEHQCVVLKGMLQSPQLNDHV